MKEIKDWLKDEANQINWKILTDSPLVKTAFEVARSHALPKPVNVATDNADTIILHTALTQATQTGWHQCLDFLEKILTAPPSTKKEQIALKTLKPDA